MIAYEFEPLEISDKETRFSIHPNPTDTLIPYEVFVTIKLNYLQQIFIHFFYERFLDSDSSCCFSVEETLQTLDVDKLGVVKSTDLDEVRLKVRYPLPKIEISGEDNFSVYVIGCECHAIKINANLDTMALPASNDNKLPFVKDVIGLLPC